jgi:hypothetical protein
MAATGNTVLTLADWAKRLDPDGTVPDIVDMLSQTNEMVPDMLFKEGNLPTGERVTISTGLPAVYFRLLNQGVPNSKSTTAQVDESCAMLEARAQLDQKIAELNGNSGSFRLSEGERFIESMNQKAAQTLLYGAASNPEEFVGLANRFSSLSAPNGKNIISAGSVTGGDATSIWLVGWGMKSVYGIFPKGSKAGLFHEDLGLGDAFDASNNRFRAYMDRWGWDLGLVVKDWRYVVRIANIDTSALIADPTGSSINLINLMLKALHRLPSYAGGMAPDGSGFRGIKPVFYCNRTVREMLDIQAQSKSNLLLTAGVEEGRMKTTLRGVPIRTMDAILTTESTVS